MQGRSFGRALAGAATNYVSAVVTHLKGSVARRALADLHSPPSEPPEWFKKVYGDYLQSEEGHRLYGKPLADHDLARTDPRAYNQFI